ncbi:MAG: hypothetical protein AB3N34_00470 [Lettuce witches'-broom phytoplasma]
MQSEKIEIVGEVGAIKVNIGKLECGQQMYTEMLTMAENYKQKLEKDYDNSQHKYGNPLENINSLYGITPSEG